MELSVILDKLVSLSTGKKNILVAIDGGSGSGKTWLADQISNSLDCNVFHMDDFYLRPEQRTPERLSETGGNVDYERFKAEVMDKILSGEEFGFKPYDCKTSGFKPEVQISPKKISVIEGSYSHHPYFGEVFDLKIFVESDRETRLARIEKRNPLMLERFIDEWIPKEDAYFKAFRIRGKCDIVIKT